MKWWAQKDVRHSVADRDLGSGAFLDPLIRDPRWEKIRIRNPGCTMYRTSQIIFREQKQFLRLKIRKFFDADPGSISFWLRIRDPGWKNSDKHPGSATLVGPIGRLISRWEQASGAAPNWVCARVSERWSNELQPQSNELSKGTPELV